MQFSTARSVQFSVAGNSARRWLDTAASVRVHGTLKQRPVVRFQDERGRLLPLAGRPYRSVVPVAARQAAPESGGPVVAVEWGLQPSTRRSRRRRVVSRHDRPRPHTWVRPVTTRRGWIPPDPLTACDSRVDALPATKCRLHETGLRRPAAATSPECSAMRMAAAGHACPRSKSHRIPVTPLTTMTYDVPIGNGLVAPCRCPSFPLDHLATIVYPSFIPQRRSNARA